MRNFLLVSTMIAAFPICAFAQQDNTARGLALKAQNAANAVQTTLNNLSPRVGTPYTTQNAPLGSFFLGNSAGAAYPFSQDNTSYSNVGIGAGALQSLTNASAEAVCIGPWACQYEVNGNTIAAIGMHALGADQNSNAVTMVGNDAGRDAETSGGMNEITCIGRKACAHGSPGQGNIGIGAFALLGNSLAVIVSGTVTTGDTLSITLNGSGGGVTGFPITGSYTVLAGDSKSTIAYKLNLATYAAAQAAGVGSPSYFIVNTAYGGLPNGNGYLAFQWPGSSTVGWAVSGTGTVTGAGTETLTITGGFTGAGDTCIGDDACEGYVATTASQNTGIGFQTLQNITTASYDTVIGYQSGNSISSGTDDILIGKFAGTLLSVGNDNVYVGDYAGNSTASGTYDTGVGMYSLQNMINTSFNTADGAKACSALTSGGSNTCLGYNTGGTTLTTGSNDLLISSSGNSVDTPAAGTSNYLNLDNVLTATSTNAPATSLVSIAGSLQVASLPS